MLHNTMIETRSLVRPRFIFWKKFDEEPMRLGAEGIVHRIMLESPPVELWGMSASGLKATMVKAITDTAMGALKALHTKKHPTYVDKWMRGLPYVAMFVENAKDYRRFNVRVFLYFEGTGHSRGYEIADKIFDFRPGATVTEKDNHG